MSKNICVFHIIRERVPKVLQQKDSDPIFVLNLGTKRRLEFDDLQFFFFNFNTLKGTSTLTLFAGTSKVCRYSGCFKYS